MYFELYHPDVPVFLQEFIDLPLIKRLQNVGMNCGCEYTAFPRFQILFPYSRRDHSIGVALIIWHFTNDPVQTVAGLLHDIATPVFSHVVDFLRGDYLLQESTEASTKEIIDTSDELQRLLKQYSMSSDDVSNYHRYPIADNETPRLSSDRLEYTIGNSLNFGICSYEDVTQIYNDLVIGLNEYGQTELMFMHIHKAQLFANAALQCSQIYVSDEDRYSMQLLSEILYFAIQHRVLLESDLYLTEPEVISKLLEDTITKDLWISFCKHNKMLVSSNHPEGNGWRKVFAKKRFIDPMVLGQGRLSKLSNDFDQQLETFKSASFNYWICALP